MSLVLFTAVLAVTLVAFGLTVWRRQCSRATTVFLFMAVSLAAIVGAVVWSGLWLAGAVQTVAQLALCFAPALAFHAVRILARRREGWFVGAAYVMSTALFALVTGMSHSWLGDFSNLASTALLGFFLAMLIVAGVELVPALHERTRSTRERRQVTYGFVLIVLFLLSVGAPLTMMFSSVSIPLASLWLAFAVLAFLRAGFLDVSFDCLQPVEILLGSALLVNLMRAQGSFQLIVGLGSAMVFFYLGARRPAAQREAIDQAKSEFVAVIAHQLRSPLGGIRFASEMLVNGDYGALPEAAKKAIGLMRQTAERLLSLAETSLAAARIDVGAFEFKPEKMDARHEIRMLLDEASLFAKAKSIELVSKVDTLPDAVMFDREVLRNVTFNLVDNAIKYTDAGSVTVRADVQDSTLVLDVTDTGLGLDQHDKTHLFKRFYRGDGPQHVHHQGIGLGLFVTKQMVEAAGGLITVESAGLGKGTTFRVVFPLGSVDDSTNGRVR